MALGFVITPHDHGKSCSNHNYRTQRKGDCPAQHTVWFPHDESSISNLLSSSIQSSY